MCKKIIGGFVAWLFLAGSIILPFSDFSLIQDIPEMYRSYTQITTPEEVGIVDFIGDYLLHGKEILGHNRRDKPQNGTSSAQFLHQANPLSVFISYCGAFIVPPRQQLMENFEKSACFQSSDYRRTLLRPPLA